MRCLSSNPPRTLIDAAGRQIATSPDPDWDGPELATANYAYYDRDGRMLGSMDAMGQTSLSVQDAVGRMLATVNPNGERTNYEYDLIGRRTKLTDPVGNITSWLYDDLDRVKTETTPTNKSGQASANKEFTYNAAGGMRQRTDRNGRKVVYQFDDLGRVTQEDWYANAASTTSLNTLAWSYDPANGRMTSTGDAGVASDAYTYDSLGRVATVTRTLDGITTAFAYEPAYSKRDERLGLTINQGATTLFDWSSKYDNLGQVEWLQIEGYSGGSTQKADFSYDKAGKTTQIQRTQGASSAARTGFGYDNQGRLVSLSHQQPGASSLAQIARYDMAYDAANRITRIDSSVDEASVYSYDKTGQLTAAQMTFENNEAYAYDSNGNRTSGDTKSNGAHKNLIVQDAKYSFEYDGENNRTKRLEKATGNYQEYVWDHRNRLQEVRFKTATGVLTKTVRYFYDASDMKVREEVIAGASNIAKYFVYDGANVVLDFVDADGHITGNAPTLDKRYFQGPGVDQLLAQENVTQSTNSPNRVWWVLPDHLGSTRDLVDTLGKVVAHYQYDSFGVLLDGRENVTRYQYTGREHDSNTDLNYHRARWYDPVSGKWISEDPIGFEAGDANVTRYVGNGVLNGVDPSGFWTVDRKFEALASAVSESGDTVGQLAKEIGLDPKEFKKWLTFSQNVVATQNGRVASNALSEDDSLCPDQQFKIPNTVHAIWSGDLGWIGRSVIGWEEDMRYLGERGFNVVELINDQRAEFQTEAGYISALHKLSEAKALHGIYAWGHGSESGFGTQPTWWQG